MNGPVDHFAMEYAKFQVELCFFLPGETVYSAEFSNLAYFLANGTEKERARQTFVSVLSGTIPTATRSSGAPVRSDPRTETDRPAADGSGSHTA